MQISDVVVDGLFFSGGGGSSANVFSAWGGNRSFAFTLAAPTSLLFAVLTPSTAQRDRCCG
jgi:hypothetical protein